MHKPILSASGLSIRFGDLNAVEKVNFEIAPGEFFALLGPSGCGKTTLLRCIGGFVEPSEGSVVIDGKDVTHAAPYERPVNMVFQSYALFPHMSARDNVAYGLRRKGKSRKAALEGADAALETVGLIELAARFPAQLSGGQQQRVALARAIVNQPKLLLLDEPLAALDLKLKKRMQLELKQLQQELGIAFVMVTHDQEEALFLADRIAVMDRGRFAQVATGRELYDRPANRFVADFIGDTNLIRCTRVGRGEWEIAGDGKRFAHAGQPSANEAFLNVRPERLTLGRATPRPDELRVKARIDGFAYMGNMLRVFAVSEGGHRLMVTETPDAVRSLNEDVDVVIDLRQALVLA